MMYAWKTLVLILVELCRGAPQVILNRTTLLGSDIGTSGVEFFGNIPFAEAPIGHLRFARPVPRFSLDVASFNATQFGASCPQFGIPNPPNVSEDCLTINIFKPVGAMPGDPIPVLAWVYGGGFAQGTASAFDGGPIVAQSIARGTPVIYVNFNYRIGPLGFPQGSEAASRGAVNLGLRDILLALEWIQQNIGAFGGDKMKVTVFGESAGAIAINQLFLDPDFGRLARAAIFQSGAAASGFLFGPERRETIWQALVAATPECAGASSGNSFPCLRHASLNTFLNASAAALATSQDEFPYIPVIDGPAGLIPDLPSRLWRAGKFARLPFISGNCEDEGTAFTPTGFNSSAVLREWMLANSTPSELPLALHLAVVDRALEVYPDVPAEGSPFGSGNATFGLNREFKRAAAWLGDLSFHSQRRLWMQEAVAVGVKAFGYLFTEPQPQAESFLGVFHSSDIPFTYGTVSNGDAEAIALSQNMVDYWLSFATSLDPNDGRGNASRTHWEQYAMQNQALLQLNGNKPRMIPDSYRDRQIGFINALPVAFRH